MYNTSADDLARIANDLSQIARKYTGGSQELDQHVTSLDNTASHLIHGGAKQWVGLASEAFQGAWEERRSRMQQASQLLSQAAQHLTQFAQTIEDNLPTIRMDQQLMQGPTSHMLVPDDQASILSGESQAQNAILTALQTLNSQLEALAEEVRDCPEEQEDGNSPGMGNDPHDNINKSDSNAGGGPDNGDNGGGNNEGGPQDTASPPLKNVDEAQIDPAKFEKYSMDPDNPNNRTKKDDPNTGKWVAFRDLGYDVSTPEARTASAQDVMDQVRDELPDLPAQPTKVTPFGSRYEVDVPIKGPNGKEGTLVTVWQYDNGSTAPRLVTNFLKVHS
jgi:uncharacterized protein YukE